MLLGRIVVTDSCCDATLGFVSIGLVDTTFTENHDMGSGVSSRNGRCQTGNATTNDNYIGTKRR